MKVAIITDQHFGARKNSKLFHDYFLKFYDDSDAGYSINSHWVNTTDDNAFICVDATVGLAVQTVASTCLGRG